jgi:hypothetical protein
MALRVARGLFRLWVVLSAVWILFVITKTWFDVTHPTTLTDTEVGLTPGMFDDLIIAARTNNALKFGAALALVPPLLVLAIGSALVWAFRGFRQP